MDLEPEKINKVPISEKLTLNVSEAVAYSGIGEHKIRELLKDKRCDFALHIGTKTLIKREKFAKFIMNSDVI